MHKQHPQTAYRKYAVLMGTIFENCDRSQPNGSRRFENEIIVVFVGQRFCVALSAWLDGKGIAKLVSAGDGRGGENLFAMGMQLLQKLEFITEEVFFQKDMCDRERRTIPMKDNDFTDIDRRILQNNVFDIKQVMLLALSVDKVIDRTARTYTKPSASR